jgi:hypothetical protein
VTSIEWVWVVVFAAAYTTNCLGWWFAQRRLTTAQAILDEARQCNDELAEAIELAQYGAVAEANEVLQRWRERAVDPRAMSRSLGGCSVRRIGSIDVKPGRRT